MDIPTKHAHFVGVGGIGMSALAQWLAADGWTVTGSDRARSEITRLLETQGIRLEPEESLPRGITLLVYSDAIPSVHPALQEAQRRGIVERSYAELLGELTGKGMTLAVAGSHGKSTTTALLGLLLEHGGHDPTVVVGTRVPQWQMGHGAWRMGDGGRGMWHGGDSDAAIGNYRRGSPDLVVVEADEYRRHFLTLAPTVAVITSVDYDHVDAFPTAAEYEGAYVEFIKRLKPGGTLVIPAMDSTVGKLLAHCGAATQIRTFVVGGESTAASIVASTPEFSGSAQRFRVWVDGIDWGQFAVPVPGAHVVANAAAAVAAAVRFDITPDVVRQTLAEFRGTWRRFERVGEVNGATVISDYAHHPTELTALYRAARQQFPGRRIILTFQPHQRARTRAFASQFLRAVRDFDVIILAEVYDVAGREEANDRTTTRTWVAPLQAAGRIVVYAPTLTDVEDAVRERTRPEDVVLVVGAGDIDTVARKLTDASVS